MPVTDLPPVEQLPAAPLVLGAYAFIWVAVLVYVALLWRRLAAVQKDLDALTHTPPR
ncbi:MAG: CcmD family protein [Vicinamibacteria bacterium]|nr:CcmD family protein [Vicinamibacteria bacterium]